MVTVRLMGGLGNQMFQYALGRTIAQRRGTSLALDVRVPGTTNFGNTRWRFLRSRKSLGTFPAWGESGRLAKDSVFRDSHGTWGACGFPDLLTS